MERTRRIRRRTSTAPSVAGWCAADMMFHGGLRKAFLDYLKINNREARILES